MDNSKLGGEPDSGLDATNNDLEATAVQPAVTPPADAAAPPAPPAGPPAPPAPTSGPPAPPADAAGPPAPPVAATPAGPVGPTVVTRAGALLRSVSPERFIAAAAAGALVFLAAWLVSLVFTLLLGVSLLESDPEWYWAFQAPAQLVGLAVAGTLTGTSTVMGVTASVSFLWLPLLITAFIAAAGVFLARRDERLHASATRGIRWLLSATTGLVLALLTVIVAAVLPLRLDSSDALASALDSDVALSSASFTAFLGALVIGTIAAYAGRARVAARVHSATPPPPLAAVPASRVVRDNLRGTAPVVVLYTAALAALLAVGLLIWTVVEVGVNALLTAPLWLPTAVLDGLGFVNFAPITLTGALSALSFGGLPDSYWMPTVLPFWATALIVIVNLALIVGAGIVLRLRRPAGAPSSSVSWVTTIVAFALVGVVASLLGSISGWTSVDAGSARDSLDGLLEGSASGRGAVGLAAWAFIVFAALGALVEVVAQFLAPALIALIPAAVIARFGRITARVGVPLTAGIPATAPVGAPVATSGIDAAAPAADAGAGAGVPVAPGATEPMTPAHKRRLLLVLGLVGGAAVLVVAASIGVAVVNKTIYSPKHQVQSYLGALVDQDASAALELSTPDGTRAERVLLTDKVFQATDGGITDFTITDVSVSGDSAQVTAELKQDGGKSTEYYELKRSGSTLLFFDDWKLQTVGLSSLDVMLGDGITELDVNGVTVPLTRGQQESGYVQLLAFAGEYTVGVAGDDKWITAEPRTAMVGSSDLGGSESVELELVPTKAFTKSVDDQVTAMVEACIALKELDADDCPMYTFDFGTVTDVAWTIDEAATFEIEESYDDEWYVTTDVLGSATVTYNRQGFTGTIEPMTTQRDFYVDGRVTLEGGEPVYAYGY